MALRAATKQVGGREGQGGALLPFSLTVPPPPCPPCSPILPTLPTLPPSSLLSSPRPCSSSWLPRCTRPVRRGKHCEGRRRHWAPSALLLCVQLIHLPP